MPVVRSGEREAAATPAASPTPSSSSTTTGAGAGRTGEMTRLTGAAVWTEAPVPLFPVGAAGRLNDSRGTAGVAEAPDAAGLVPAGTGMGAAGRLEPLGAAGRLFPVGAGRDVVG